MNWFWGLLDRCKRKKLSELEIMEKAKTELEKWKVDMYTSNPHLYTIPSERINAKFRSIVKEIKQK